MRVPCDQALFTNDFIFVNYKLASQARPENICHKKQGTSSVYRIPFGLYIKLAESPDEAPVMKYVCTRTTIPVPVVLDCFQTTWCGPDSRLNDPHMLKLFGRTEPYRKWLIVMKASPGKPITGPEGTKFVGASEKQLQNLRDGLANWVSLLRSLPPHSQRVSGFLGGPFHSFRINASYTPIGTFHNPTEFYSQNYCTAYPDYPDKGDDRLRRLTAERPQKEYKICLTHGDILPFNILVDDELHPTGLIDWECAGWMPEYWENAASLRASRARAEHWLAIIKDSFPEYEDDMVLEQRIQTWYEP